MSASERADWEAHFADCAKCRRSLALMARLKETASPEWRGETSRDVATSGGSLWVWMPLAACVLVGAGLWLATRPAQRAIAPSTTTMSEQARAGAPESTSATSEGALKRPVSPVDAHAASRAKVRDQNRREDEARAAKRDAPNQQLASGAPRQQIGGPSQNAQNADQRDAKQEAQLPSSAMQVGAAGSGVGGVAGAGGGRGVAPAAAAAAPPTPAPASTPAAAEPPASAQRAPAAEAVIVTSARKAAKSSDSELKSSVSLRNTLTSAERANGLLAVVADPTVPARQWRIFRVGSIEVTHDGGGTWASELRQSDRTFAAVASPAPGVCWVVGTKGGVWRLALGANNAVDELDYAAAALGWQTREVPTAEDLVSVTASNALSAVVTTKFGARFATTDGGKTWTRQ